MATSMGRVGIDEVRRLALTLPRTHEALVGDRVKFRVGRLVYLAFSRRACTPPSAPGSGFGSVSAMLDMRPPRVDAIDMKTPPTPRL